MRIRTIGMITACLGFSLSSAFAQEENVDAPAVEDWAMTVIELDYANAEEVAALLAEIVPPASGSLRTIRRTASSSPASARCSRS